MAEQDLLADLSDVVESSELDNMVQGVLETGQVDGTQFAVPMSINVKSIVFYPKQPFEAAVYKAPTTYDELVALSDEIQATGPPWCFGIESEAATGWPATDWVENLMVINNGADVYNEWVNHEIPFNDITVAETLAQMNELLLDEGGPTVGGVDRQQQLRHGGLPALRRAAGLLHVPAGQLRRAGGRAPGRGHRRPRQHRRLRDARQDGQRQAGARWRRPRRHLRRTTSRPRSWSSSSRRRTSGREYGASGN